MPQAFYISSALADLSVDVSLSSTARGDLLYRGATKWNNLAHGTTGQFLKTNGAGADPSWATVDLTPLVVLAPASLARNLIQPTGDCDCLTLQPFADAQTTPVVQGLNAAGNLETFQIDPKGNATLRQVIAPFDASAAELQAFADDWGGMNSDCIVGLSRVGLSMDLVGVQTAEVPTLNATQYFTLNAAAPVGLRAGFLGSMSFQGEVDNAGALSGRAFRLNCGGTDILLAEPSKVAFLGAAAVARQLLATGTGHTVDDVITVLQTFGLCKQA